MFRKYLSTVLTLSQQSICLHMFICLHICLIKSRREAPQRHLSNEASRERRRTQGSIMEDMCQPPGHLEYLAKMKAQCATFPGAAFDASPLGRYAIKYAAELDALAAARGAQPKVHKTSRNFLARTSYDAVQIQRLFDFGSSPEGSSVFSIWGEAFKKCCTVLPDLDYCGYVALSEEAFQNKFQGDARNLLHHMFEKHSGEIVVVWKADRGLEDLTDTLPSVRQELHQPQYYTLNTEEVDVKRNLANCYFTKNKAVKGHAMKDLQASARQRMFCWQMQDVANSVYNPVTFQVTQKFEVGYFSLPSLVWELFPWHTLMDLYTFFCTRPLLTARRPHPRRTNTQRLDAALLPKAETGYWGFGGK